MDEKHAGGGNSKGDEEDPPNHVENESDCCPTSALDRCIRSILCRCMSHFISDHAFVYLAHFIRAL